MWVKSRVGLATICVYSKLWSDAATQILATGTISPQTPATGTTATYTPVMDDAAEPKNKLMLVSVSFLSTKKWTRKAGCLLQEDKAGTP